MKMQIPVKSKTMLEVYTAITIATPARERTTLDLHTGCFRSTWPMDSGAQGSILQTALLEGGLTEQPPADFLVARNNLRHRQRDGCHSMNIKNTSCIEEMLVLMAKERLVLSPIQPIGYLM